MLNRIDLSRTDLNLLVLFEAVLEARHVGRAAQALSLTPSAVSHGLGRLRRLLNDPLFMRTPKGVVPTARAAELAGPIGEILAAARSVVASAEPFDPTTSRRRFTVAAPDATLAVILLPLLAALRTAAPGIDLSVRQLLPAPGGRAPGRPWDQVLADLEGGAFDIAVAPLDDVPARFVERVLREEDFVIAIRAGHPFADDPSLERYCAMRHLVVSLTDDTRGLVDDSLARRGRSRRVALAVPNFMLALTLVAESDLIAAVPRSLVAAYAGRFGLASTEAPLPLRRFAMRAVAPKVAMTDAGLAWLFELLVRIAQEALAAPLAATPTRPRPGPPSGARSARRGARPPTGRTPLPRRDRRSPD